MNTLRRSALVLAIAGLFAGCAVGPDFEKPEPPEVDRYVAGAPSSHPAAPKLDPRRPIPAEWWTLFGSPELDALAARALEKSPTLAEARARLTRAQELLAARTGTVWLPQADLTAGAVRQRIDPATVGFPQAPNPGVFNVYSLGAQASYVFDLWGGGRRELEALSAGVDVESFQGEAARLTLATNVVVTSLRVAALDSKLEILGEILALRRRQLEISQGRLAAGGVSEIEVKNEQVLVAQSEAALAPLRAERAHAEHLLAVLSGEAPGARVLPALRLADLKLPEELPLRLPAELVRRRPDIRAGEALLHQACAEVGVAAADLYPKLALHGALSSSRLDLSDIFGNGVNVWSFGADLLAPLYRGGELRARKRAAEATFEAAGASYRRTVLTALQNVADVLRSLEQDAEAHAALSTAAERAEEAWRVASDRFTLGGVSEYALLDADRRRRETRGDRLQRAADRLVDVAALYQALGGGWIGDAPAPESR